MLAHVTPSFNDSGEIIGYHSNRRVPDMGIVNRHIVPLYAKLLDIEKSHESPKDGMAAAFQAVADLLAENKVGFNQLMFSLEP